MKTKLQVSPSRIDPAVKDFRLIDAADMRAEAPAAAPARRFRATIVSPFEDGRLRCFVYFLVCALCLGAVVAGMLVKTLALHKGFNLVKSDGRGYYVYLPSLLIDGDLDFANQIRNHWDIEFHPDLLRGRTPRGLVHNKYPVGMALSLLPAFLAGHAGSLGLHSFTGSPLFLPNGYSLLYQVFGLVLIQLFGLFAMILTDRLLVERFKVPGRAVLAAVLAFWLGTHYAYYFLREPFMVHVVSGFWVTAAVYLVHVILARRDEGRSLAGPLLLLGFALAMAVVCRPTNLCVVGPFTAYLAFRLAASGPRALLRGLLPIALGGVVPVLAQMSTWYALNGRWIHYSYEGEGFAWGQPALWQTLLSSRHGLFFWSPLLVLSVAGLGWYAVVKRGARMPLLVCYLLGGLALWYANSSWHVWWFGDAFVPGPSWNCPACSSSGWRSRSTASCS